MNYVYIQSESGSWGSLYTVGFYDPDDQWQPESDWNDSEEAAARVHYLNGGRDVDGLIAAINELGQQIEVIERYSTSHRHYGGITVE